MGSFRKRNGVHSRPRYSVNSKFLLWSKVLARIVLIPATFKVTGVPQMGTSVKPVSLAASRQEIFLDSVSAPCRALAPPMGGLGGLGSSDGHSVVKVRLYDSGGLLREALNMFAAGELYVFFLSIG